MCIYIYIYVYIPVNSTFPFLLATWRLKRHTAAEKKGSPELFPTPFRFGFSWDISYVREQKSVKKQMKRNPPSPSSD
ncbi:hypothetical protein M433DRAFT_329498 [Acidomyces richmondensis BFW]|nr:hypothetical protein M433DRAFT_329498 [Acidomyces richmondensis BFW]